MNNYFHGIGRKYPYFEGWYLKHQNERNMTALIPAVFADEKGKWIGSIQVITEDGAWYFEYPSEECHISRGKFCVKIGNSLFSESGTSIDIDRDGFRAEGTVHYSPFTPPRKDIMGPFRFLPFMECSHGILSMSHKLIGKFTVNGKTSDFTDGEGYIETDYGTSFPKKYAWTQCCFRDGGRNSLMAAVAEIPLFGTSFSGCICNIYYRASEYRIATYRGARIVRCDNENIIIHQGDLKFSVMKLGECSFGLKAPVMGKMKRMIYESPVCRVRYCLWEKGRLVFDVISSRASYESEWKSK